MYECDRLDRIHEPEHRPSGLLGLLCLKPLPMQLLLVPLNFGFSTKMSEMGS
jgi:hypothetical protein